MKNKFMKSFYKATYHLMFFKTYTTMPRWMEIGYGVLFWLGVMIVIYAIFF